MPDDADWITYLRERRGKLISRTLHASEPPPFGTAWHASPATARERDDEMRRRANATAREIKLEKAKRISARTRVDEWNTLRNRQEFNDARAIHNALGMIQPDRHPLDRLSPEEWTELRRKIVG